MCLRLTGTKKKGIVYAFVSASRRPRNRTSPHSSSTAGRPPYSIVVRGAIACPRRGTGGPARSAPPGTRRYIECGDDECKLVVIMSGLGLPSCCIASKLNVIDNVSVVFYREGPRSISGV